MKWLVDSGFSRIPGNHSNPMWTVAGVNPAVFIVNPAVSANNPAILQ
ncbi:hypothetical protein [Rossellomorea sp. DA94]|nr:hypothetical protein [Rossellomorea sp. DA94]WGG46975.1 hypothetical protein P8596_07170 [Rossellomorea sp. DA94]